MGTNHRRGEMSLWRALPGGNEMNPQLTVSLLKGEIQTIMKRVAKADRRLAKVPDNAERLIGGASAGSELNRKERLLKRVSELKAQIQEIENETPTTT
jgi:hypothetical protein